MSALTKLKMRAKYWEAYAKNWGKGKRKQHVSHDMALTFAKNLWREYHRQATAPSDERKPE